MKFNIQRFAAPSVTFAPLNSATKVAFEDPTITITFSAAVRNIDDSAIVDADLADLLAFKKTNNSGAVVPYSATINAEKTIITVVPTSDLLPNQAYYLAVLATSFENANDDAVEAISATWTTVTQPTITFAPLHEATGVDTNAPTITLTFQEAVRHLDDSAIVNADTAEMIVFKETNASGDNVAFTSTIDGSKKVITIVPAELKPNQLYYVGFAAGQVENEDDIVNAAQTATWTTSGANTVASTASTPNSIVQKALVAGDIDGNFLTLPAGDEKTIIILYNSGASTRVVQVEPPLLPGYAGSVTPVLSASLLAGQIAVVNVESAKYADVNGKINIDVAHADVKYAIFHRS